MSRNAAARMTEIILRAQRQHSDDECALLGDFMWAEESIAERSLPADRAGYWKSRFGTLKTSAYVVLGEFADRLKAPPVASDDRVVSEFQREVDRIESRLGNLWRNLESAELEFALEYPETLVKDCSSLPPNLRTLGTLLSRGKELLESHATKAPSALVDVTAELCALARRLNANPETLDDAMRLITCGVEILRRLAPIAPDDINVRLGAALAISAQTQLFVGNVDEAALAAVEACALALPEAVPEEVKGLAQSVQASAPTGASRSPTDQLDVALLHRPGGDADSNLYSTDFLVNGTSLHVLLGAHLRDLAGCFMSRAIDGVRGRQKRILAGELPSELPNDRIGLFVCPICGDLGFGAITCKLEILPDRVIWSKFGYEVDWKVEGEPDDSRLDLTPYVGIGPFAFERNAYLSALDKAVGLAAAAS